MHIDLPPDLVPMPRERALAEGVASLSDAELLALQLGTGMRGVSALDLGARILRAFGGLDGVVHAGALELADIPGVGIAKALRIMAAVELGRRYVLRAGRRHEPIESSAAVFERFLPVLGGKESEELWMMALDACNCVRGCRHVALGGVHACGMNPRDLLRIALAESAVGMVVVHNHPSGNPAPSMDDIVMTRRLLTAADVVGVTLIDHLILGSGGDYRSMLDMGFIPERVATGVDLAQRPYGTRLVTGAAAP